jgi:hypothetical protein
MYPQFERILLKIKYKTLEDEHSKHLRSMGKYSQQPSGVAACRKCFCVSLVVSSSVYCSDSFTCEAADATNGQRIVQRKLIGTCDSIHMTSCIVDNKMNIHSRNLALAGMLWS